MLRPPAPDFLLIGANKAGTTSLIDYLRLHPRIFISRIKEPCFFSDPAQRARGEGWYESLFAGARPDQLRGEGSTTYSRWPYLEEPWTLDPREEILARRPDVRLVYLVRHPVDRAFSHYYNNLRLGRENLSFEDAIDAEEERIAGEEERLLSDPQAVSLAHKRYSYLRRGLYAEQLLRWQSCFPEEQLLLVDAGRLFTDPRAVVAEVLAFVGVDPWEPPNFAARNEGRHGEAMQAATRSRLEVFYEPHEQRLSDLIGWCPSAGRRRMAA